MTRFARTRWQMITRTAWSASVLAVLMLGSAGCSEGKADDASSQADAQEHDTRRPGVLSERLDGVYAGYDENGYPVYVHLLSANTRATAQKALAMYTEKLAAIEGFDPETILSAFPDEADPSVAKPAILFPLDISGDKPRLLAPYILGRTGTVDRIWSRDEAFKRGPINPMCERLTVVGQNETRIWYGPFLRPDGLDSRAIYTYYGLDGAASVLGLTMRETLDWIIDEGVQRDEDGNIRICTSECLCCQ